MQLIANCSPRLFRHKEQANYNQYWYSDNTISAIIQVGRGSVQFSRYCKNVSGIPPGNLIWLQ